MRIYRCEDSIESIFTAIYCAYEDKAVYDCELVLHDEPMLFAEDVNVVPDAVRVYKVMDTLQKRFGERDYYGLCLALASDCPKKAQYVFGTVRHGLAVKTTPGHLFDQLTDENVLETFKLVRNANRELEHLLGFLRFQELDNGILYSKIGPHNNILTFLMPHFADRLPIENFVIYDDTRGIFGIHPAKSNWYLRIDRDALEPELHFSEGEKIYSELFRVFCKSIAIQSRENRNLQRNMLPLRFRKYMMEFDSH